MSEMYRHKISPFQFFTVQLLFMPYFLQFLFSEKIYYTMANDIDNLFDAAIKDWNKVSSMASDCCDKSMWIYQIRIAVFATTIAAYLILFTLLWSYCCNKKQSELEIRSFRVLELIME
jgi:hypothetical protein